MTASEIQAAITEAITKIVQQQGCWGAVTLSGKEVSFRMNDTGAIGVYLQDDETGEEEEYCFRLEIVED